MKKTTLTLSSEHEETVEVEAWILGPLAIHRELSRRYNKRWMINHLATGRTLSPVAIQTKDIAAKICRRLRAEFPELLALTVGDEILAAVEDLDAVSHRRFEGLIVGKFDAPQKLKAIAFTPGLQRTRELYALARGEAGTGWHKVGSKLGDPAVLVFPWACDRRMLTAALWALLRFSDQVTAHVEPFEENDPRAWLRLVASPSQDPFWHLSGSAICRLPLHRID